MSRLEIPQATNRADFMRDEGTALFTQLAQTAIPALFNLEDTEDIIHRLPEISSLDLAGHPLRHAFNVADAHASMVYGLFNPNYNPMYAHFKTEGLDMPANSNRILRMLHAYTFYKEIPTILHEAYNTTLIFPLKLLEYAHKTASEQNIPPPITTYDDVAEAYRSPWLQQACTDAAMTANAVWGSFSTSPYTTEPLFADVLDLDFEVTNTGTTFSFSDNALRALRGKLQERNKAMRAKFKRVGKMAQETTDAGTTSGCPVAHDKPGFRLSDPTETERLQGIAWITSASTEELMNPGKNGIAYGMDAAATLFERCAPFVKEPTEPAAGAIDA